MSVDTAPGWLVTFDRVGRDHAVPPLTMPSSVTGDLDAMAERVGRYAAPRLLSPDVEVFVRPDLTGYIAVGSPALQSAGSFTITTIPAEPEAERSPLDDFTADILDRCRSAVRNHKGRPSPAWSHGEQMIVALVLNDDAFLADVGSTVDLARQRLHGDLCWLSGRAWSADDLTEWITNIRDTAQAGE